MPVATAAPAFERLDEGAGAGASASTGASGSESARSADEALAAAALELSSNSVRDENGQELF